LGRRIQLTEQWQKNGRKYGVKLHLLATAMVKMCGEMLPCWVTPNFKMDFDLHVIPKKMTSVTLLHFRVPFGRGNRASAPSLVPFEY
jgi:hypothetical protein